MTPAQASLDQALGRSQVVVGVASTALVEGWLAGCKVVYLKGVIDRSAVLDPHQGSRNVLCVDEMVECDTIRSFIEEPAVLDVDEDRRVGLCFPCFAC